MVETGGVGGSEMQWKFLMPFQDRSNLQDLVKSQIVCDHVVFVTATPVNDHVGDEGNKLCITEYCADFVMERCVQRQGAVPETLKAVLRPSGVSRRYRFFAVERLDCLEFGVLTIVAESDHYLILPALTSALRLCGVVNGYDQ